MADDLKGSQIPVSENTQPGDMLMGIRKTAGGHTNFNLSVNSLLEATNGAFMGLAEGDTNPGTPETARYYQGEAGTTYQYFKNSLGTSIEIPSKVGEQYVVDVRLIWEGGSWRATWGLVNEPSLSGVVKNSEISIESVNEFDQTAAYVTNGDGKGIGSDGIGFNLSTAHSVWNFPALPNQKYTITGAAMLRGLIFKNSSGVTLSPIIGMPVNGVPFTTPANTVSLSFQYADANNPKNVDTIQIQKGEATPYQPYAPAARRILGAPIEANSVSVGANMGGDKIASERYVDEKSGTVQSNLYEFETDYNKFISKKTEVAQIQPSPDYSYIPFVQAGNPGVGEIRSWYFGKTVKKINVVGVFIWKRLSLGEINTDGRVQVLVKRDNVSTVLCNKVIPNADLRKFNTEANPGTLPTKYRDFELKVELNQTWELQPGDQLFTSVQVAAKIQPVYGDVNALNPDGEWNSDVSGAVKCYRAWPNTGTTIFSTVPPLPPIENNYNAVHFYLQTFQPFKGLQQFDERIKDLQNGSGAGGTEDFSFTAPTDLYFTNALTATGRKEPLMLFLQRFIREKREIKIDNRQFFTVLSKDDKNINNAPLQSEVVSVTLGGGASLIKSIPINRHSVSVSVLADKFPKVVYFGDSITENRWRNGVFAGAGALWSMSKEIAMKNRVDNGGNGYDYLAVGAGAIANGTITYKGQTLAFRGFANGYGGWTAPTWLRHPIRLWVNAPGGWDMLGLSTVTGRSFSGSIEDKKLINATNYGANAPIVSANSYALLVSEGQIANLGSWTGSIEQIAAAQAWIDGIASGTKTPQNFCFDINKSGTNRFSLQKFVDQYKTLAADGTTRLVVGSTAGSRVTNINSMDVPNSISALTHSVICLGENDHIFHSDYVQICNDLFELANEMKSQVPTINVGICLTDMPGSMFPDRTPDYFGKFYQDKHNVKYDLHKELISRFGTLAQQKANRIYYIPTWFCMTPLSHSTVSEQVDESKPNRIIQVGIDDYNHPGYYANRSGGSQVYGWVAYTYT